MSATDEELRYVHEGGMDHVTYILIMFRYVCSVVPPYPKVPSLTHSSFRIFFSAHPTYKI